MSENNTQASRLFFAQQLREKTRPLKRAVMQKPLTGRKGLL